MPMAKSNPSKTRKATTKPQKPRPDFPLFPHATGRWAKKVRGKLQYFGKISDDPKGQAALSLWLDQKDDLLAGRKPRATRDGLTVAELCNRFLEAKRARVSSGELAMSTWTGYKVSSQHIIRWFGRNRLVEDLRPDDFRQYRAELSKTNGLVGLANQVRHARSVFGYAYKADLIDRPVKFGPDFSIPSARSLRKQRTPRMFEADEIQLLLKYGNPAMKAMILLAVNGGLGNADVERLTINAIDFEDGWLTYPRPKTGAHRRIPLWPETLEAVQTAITVRRAPASKDLAERVFLTNRGASYHKEATRYLTEQFREFLKAIDRLEAEKATKEGRKAPEKLYRKGVGFYTLRHVFETIAGESCDQVAVDAIMGHERGDMASVYRERISDERLERVVNVVRDWLYAADEPEADDDQEPAVVKFRMA